MSLLSLLARLLNGALAAELVLPDKECGEYGLIVIEKLLPGPEDEMNLLRTAPVVENVDQYLR